MHSSPIRVLHLITGLGVGGAETMLAKLLSHLDRSRFSSSVVSMIEPGPLAKRITGLGIPVDSMGLTRGFPSPWALPRLVALIRARRPMIVQTWMYHANLLGLIAAKLAGAPKVVWNIRCSDLGLSGAPRSLRSVVRLHGSLARFADAAVVNSASGMRFHQAIHHRPPRWELIPNGFDLTHFRPDERLRAQGRAGLGLGRDSITIGIVARLDPLKDHATFIAAAKLLHASHPTAVFVLAGAGLTWENREIVESLQRGNIAANTRLLGEVADPSELFPCLDIATLCSTSEGFPNAIGEAMSCEVPCVATDVGDSALLVGDTGRVIAPRDPRALAQSWAELIALGPDGRRRLGAAARSRIDHHFSLQSIVGAYETLYADLARA